MPKSKTKLRSCKKLCKCVILRLNKTLRRFKSAFKNIAGNGITSEIDLENKAVGLLLVMHK